MLMVELLARMPDLRRRIQRDHVSDATGHCRDCHGARWPCEVYQLANQADRLHAARSPWPPPTYQNRGAPPPGIRRDPVPGPWPGSRSYPPLGGPASWPAQRVQRMPPSPAGRSPGPYPGGPASPPSGWPPPTARAPYPAGAPPAWQTPPIDQPAPVPPPRSGSPSWQSWPSSWTPDVPVPRQGGDPLSAPGDIPGPAAGYAHDTGLGWEGNAPPRHSVGFAGTSRTRPPEPRPELASVLEDVLRWSR